MLGNAGTYAMKKRKKPVQKPKKLPGVDGVIKSNPSKRHRDRLNGELDRLTDLLPFSEDIRTRLDKLSVLRLSVGYLRVKGFFKATMKKQSVMCPGGNGQTRNGLDATNFSEGDLLLQALNGFVIVVTAEGLVFYSSPTIQDYLGFHQSDVVHQSVYELIHTDDRGMFREQLHFALNPKPYAADQGGDGVTTLQCSSDQVYDAERLPPENSSFLERSFVCRFRCLLDNSSGFLALKFQGRLKYLHGQSIMSEDGSRVQSQLALFSIAVPVQAPGILEIRTKTLIFQTKHKLDFTPMGIDNRGKVVLGYSEMELCMRGTGYQFIHAADMMYCADTHIRMMKTGESGLTTFRLLSKSGGWVWVQANAKLVYKAGRPDFIIARQRALVSDQVYDAERLPPENSSFLERSFVCRFRCLLDNSSGFLALKFQGRLKYLHGQSIMSEDGSRVQSQLALFSIAVPVQAPGILEIRTKTLIFQTKHKLDFTPMGIDNRGKVVLGYSEMELCMRGTGYQFIHAADMMYCADTHIRMMKTGESGLTTFRLLSKSGGWVWVQANAKLVYKAGRPDFIIARQRALVNAEGEEHLRQRRLQLPFNFTTGEALLYEVGPTLDVTQMQANQSFARSSGSNDQQKEVGGLLGCFLNQDKNAYLQDAERQLPVDQVFMESRALVNVPSDPWQTLGLRADTSGNMLIKEEGDPSVVAMIDALENLAQDGELCTALEGLDVDPGELMEWENTLQKLSHEENSNGDDANRTKYELESLLNNDIFAYMENVLFKEITEANTGQSSCFSSVNNNQGDPFGQEAHFCHSGDLCEMMTFQSPSGDANAHSPAKGLNPAVPRPTHNGPASVMGRQNPAMFNSTQKLSHYGPPIAETINSVPIASQLLTDFFNPSVNLPGLNLPTLPLGGKDQRSFEPCGKASVSHYQGVAGKTQSNQTLSNQTLSNQTLSNQTLSNKSLQPCPLIGMPEAPMAANGHLLHGSIQQPAIHVAPNVVAPVPSMLPQNDFSLPANPSENSALNLFTGDCLVQGGAPFQTHSNHRVPQWQQNPQHQQQTLPHAGIAQNAHALPAGSHSQHSESQRLAGLWAQNYNGVANHAPHGGLAGPLRTTPSSCMLDPPLRAPPVHTLPHPHPLPNGNLASANGTGLIPAMPPCQRANKAPMHQSPPKGYVQWGQGSGVLLVGTTAGQDNATLGTQSRQLLPDNISLSTPEDGHAMQHYLDCNKHAQMLSLPAEDTDLLAIPPLVDENMYFSDQSQLNCCNF